MNKIERGLPYFRMKRAAVCELKFREVRVPRTLVVVGVN